MDTVNEILMPAFIFVVTFCFLCCQVSGNKTVHAEVEAGNSVPEVEAVAEELVAEEPVAEEPVAAEPVAAEPVAAEPVVEEPVAAEPVAEEPVAAEPVVEEPVAEEPVAAEPVAAEPVAAEPVAAELYEEALKIINGLKKLEARKLCKPLDIQQKRNKVELSKDILVGNIKKKFKENPRLVIDIISEKLNINFGTTDSIKAA